jgi:subtilisin-like proprotein convertase family protein
MHRRSAGLNASVSVLVALVAVLWSQPSRAVTTSTVPPTVLVEGSVQSSSGGPATDGSYGLTFAIYADELGGTATWFEGPVTRTVKGGAFDHVLGSVKPLTAQVLGSLGKNVWLGVKVGTEPEMPRRPLHAVLYARKAGSADAIGCSGCIGATQLAASVLQPYAKSASLAKVATTGKYEDLAAAIDLSTYVKAANVAKVATTGDYADLVDEPDLSAYIKAAALKKVATTGAIEDLSGAPTLATVATSGAYADVTKAPAVPKVGQVCGTGLILRGLMADGTYDCIRATDESLLPPDGLDEISNGFISNEFLDSIPGPAGVAILDNNPIGKAIELVVNDIGVAKDLAVKVDLTNTKINTLQVFLYDPENNEYLLHDKSGSGTVLKTSWPAPTKTVSGDLGSWVGKNPKGKWILKTIDSDFLNNGNDGQVNSWSIELTTASNKKARVTSWLTATGTVTAKNMTSFPPQMPEKAMYRWNVWSTYDFAQSWMAGNDATLFGGINPSTWGDGQIYAGSLSSDKAVLRALFSQKTYQAPNSVVHMGTYRDHFSPTGGRFAGALFRIKNTTASAISWTPRFYFSSNHYIAAYGYFYEYASAALNGSTVWTYTANCWSCDGSVTMTIPANRTSTAVFISAGGPVFLNGSANYGILRPLVLAFHSNSLTLPAGLEYVDDLHKAANGWTE